MTFGELREKINNLYYKGLIEPKDEIVFVEASTGKEKEIISEEVISKINWDKDEKDGELKPSAVRKLEILISD